MHTAYCILHVRVLRLRTRTARCTSNCTLHACTITCGVHCFKGNCRCDELMTGKSITENDKSISIQVYRRQGRSQDFVIGGAKRKFGGGASLKKF